MLCYAGNHVIGRSVHGELPPLGLSFWRWLTGAALLFPFLYPGLRAAAPHYREHWRLFAVLGLLMVGSTTLVLVGLNFTTATNTSLINATQPTITTTTCPSGRPLPTSPTSWCPTRWTPTTCASPPRRASIRATSSMPT